MQVNELLLELLALELSAALIDQAVHQAGRCVGCGHFAFAKQKRPGLTGQP